MNDFRITTLRVLATFAGLLGGTAVHSQDYLTYASVRFGYEESNHGVDYFEMYRKASVMTSQARATLPHELDLAFGQDPKQKLDIYMPKQKPSGAPVLLFVHGGAFEEGDRAHYGYVAMPLARAGIVTAVMSYRLVTRDAGNKIDYRDQEADVRNAIIWLYHNVAKYGGDPTKIFLMGHSAGATLTANLALDRSWLAAAGAPKTIIRGLEAVSGGTADATPANTAAASGSAATPREGPDMKHVVSPIQHINDPAPRVVFSYGEKETSDQRTRQLANMKSALQGKTDVAVVVEPGADHSGAVLALADERSPETQAILRIIRESR